MNSLHIKLLLPVCCAALASACSAYPRTEADFGDSVRHMVRSQTANPGPTDPSPVETGDGERLNGVLEAYRTDVARTEQAPAPVVVGFGSAPQ